MKKKNSIFDYVLHIYFILLSLLTFFPFYNVIILSVANTKAYINNVPYIRPYVVDWTGFKLILKNEFFLKSFLVTLFVTIVGTTLNVLLSTITAYALSRPRLVGRKFVLKFIIFTMLFSGGMVPTYLVVSKLGLLNSVWAMILPCLINTYYVIIMKNYFQSLPKSLEEAALLDGANDIQVLFRVYIPISKPFIATFTLFYAVERWNEWWHAYLYISDRNIKPLQIYLKELLATYNTQIAPQLHEMLNQRIKIFPQSLEMSTILITMVPILMVYPFIQKYFVRGLLLGSVKE